MPVASENLPKPTRIDLTMADTEELRTWTAGWCLRFCRPMQDGALHLDPWTLRAGPVHVAAFMSGQGAGTSRPAGVPKAVRVTLDANALRASKSPRMASQDGWITRFDDGPPLRILWHAECGELRCAVEVQPAFAANTWVGRRFRCSWAYCAASGPRSW